MKRLVRAGGIGGVLAALAACGSDTSGPKTERFTASMSTALEIPTPSASTASGSAIMTIVDANTVTFSVTTTAMDLVKLAHFHRAPTTTAGPVVFGFISNNPPVTIAAGTLATGTITRAASTFGVPGFTFDSLLTDLRAGLIYVNVHTVANPAGEIRGNLAPAP